MITIKSLHECFNGDQLIGSPAEAMVNLPDLRFEVFGALIEFVAQLELKMGDRESALTKREAEFDQAQSVIASRDTRISELEAEIIKLTAAPLEDWPRLAKGWMASAIGKKARNTPEIDQSEMMIALILRDYSVLQMAYGHVLAKLVEVGNSATKTDMDEIGKLVLDCGFGK